MTEQGADRIDDAEGHIAALEAAGLIDAALAERLRVAARGLPGAQVDRLLPGPDSGGTVGSFFGPDGEGYVRMALVPTQAECERAAEILEAVL